MIRALYKLIQNASLSSLFKWTGFTFASCSTRVLFTKQIHQAKNRPTMDWIIILPKNGKTRHERKIKVSVVYERYRNFLSSPAAYSSCFFPTDIQETSAACEQFPMSDQLNFPRTLYGSEVFCVASTSELLGRSICGLCTLDDIMDRSDDDHHDELERCPWGDAGEWLSDVDDLDGTGESAREMNMFFIHLTISSDKILG